MIIVKFGAKWCAPCKAIKGEVAKFSKARPDVRVVEKDLDKTEDFELAEKLGVRAIPTLLWFEMEAELDGKKPKPLAESNGLTNAAQITRVTAQAEKALKRRHRKLERLVAKEQAKLEKQS